MGSLGRFLILIGGGSFLLHLANMEFKLLMWVDHWGSTTGNIIRVALVGLGAALYLIDSKRAARAVNSESFDDIKPKEPA